MVIDCKTVKSLTRNTMSDLSLFNSPMPPMPAILLVSQKRNEPTYPVSTPIRDWRLSADRVLAFPIRLASSQFPMQIYSYAK